MSCSEDETVKVWNLPLLQYSPLTKAMYSLFQELLINKVYKHKYGKLLNTNSEEFWVSNFGDITVLYDKSTDDYKLTFFINALSDFDDNMKMYMPIDLSLTMDRQGIIQSVSTDIPEEFPQLKAKIEVGEKTFPTYIDMLQEEKILLPLT